jgi:hypothetical protein
MWKELNFNTYKINCVLEVEGVVDARNYGGEIILFHRVVGGGRRGKH